VSGHYVFIEKLTGSGKLIDQRTGKRVSLTPPPGCNFADPPFGGSWLAAECLPLPTGADYPFQLYSVPTGTWMPFNPDLTDLFALNPDCRAGDPRMCGANYLGIGDRWIEFQVAYGYHSGAIINTFEQIENGQVSAEPASVTPGGNQILDLGSPSLTRTLCEPLHVPVLPGAIIPDGRFAIDKEAAAPDYIQHAYLERCGSSLHETIGTDLSVFTADSRAVLWSAGAYPSELTGVLLPSLRRLTLRLPQQVASLCKQRGAVCIEGLALTIHALYLIDWNGDVWAARSPLR
jgi:hypothetical protein